MGENERSDRGERLQIMLSQQEFAALDDWRFARRMPSRAAAVRELLRRGLAAEGIEVAVDGQRSQDYGVIEGGMTRVHDGANGGARGNGDGSSANE
jgi:hypothetical protein